jgi:nitrous oxide reductase accessory protein NosL
MKKQIISGSSGKKLLMLVTVLFAGMFLSSEMKAQDKPAASLAANGVLQLPSNVALAPAYYISINSFGFQNDTQAIQFFKSKNYNSFFIRPNVAQGKAFIYLDMTAHPGWTVSQWNNLLNSQTTQTPLLN